MTKGISKPRSTRIRNIEERGGRGHAEIDLIKQHQQNHNKAMDFNKTAPKGVRADSLAVQKLRQNKASGETVELNRRSQENLK